MNAPRRVKMTPDFRMLQFLYGLRVVWWGIGSALGMAFSLPFLNYLRNWSFSIVMIGIGLIGLISATKQYYWLSYWFHISAILLFSMVSYSFFFNQPESIAGVNYALETAGLMWMTFRVARFDKLHDN